MLKVECLMKDVYMNIYLYSEETTWSLFCYAALSLMKYNIGRYFDTKHGAKYAKFNLQEKLVIQDLNGRLKSQ